MRLPSSLNHILLLTLVVIGSTGCRSGMSGFDTAWKRPDLSGLAFWKKQDAPVPSPPAVHFDPTPAVSDKVAKQSNSRSKSDQEQELKNSLDKLAEYEEKAADSTKTAPAQFSDKTRAVASNAENKVEEFKASASRDFNTLTSSPDSLKSAVKSKTDQSAELARSEFNAAMQNKADGVTSGVSSTQSSVSDLSKDFQPIKQSIDQTKSIANQRLQPNGNGTANSQLDETFPKSDAAGRTSKIASTAEQEQEKLNQIGSRGSALTNPLSAEQQRLDSEVAKAQREIAELKAQLSNRTQPPLANVRPNSTNQLQPVESQSARDNPLAPLGSFERPSFSKNDNPLNSTKLVDGAATVKADSSTFKPNSEFSKPAAPISPGQYATTNQSRFAPIQPLNSGNSTTPPTSIQRVGLNTPESAAEPGDRYAVNPKDHVSEVAIPDSVLQGKGNFAPGSVNRLRGQ